MISATILRDDNTKNDSVIAIVSDISTRKKNEEENLKQMQDLEEIVQQRTKELEAAKLKAETADKLKSAFLANMSHEIRTPMNAILGFADLLIDPELTHEEVKEYVNHITSSGEMLLTLIEDIIDISKIEADQLKINISDCNINKTLEDLQATFEQYKIKLQKTNTEIRTQFALDSLILKTDIQRFKQIVSNLVGNAIKFTQNGFVEYGYEIDPQHIGFIKFYVKDSGIGIPENLLEVIFERFRKIDESQTKTFGGTGLGLAISKRLVEMLNGKIWVDSTLNTGSAFYFTLPFVAGNSISEDIENIESIISTINNRPRKSLNWKKPSEIFSSVAMEY